MAEARGCAATSARPNASPRAAGASTVMSSTTDASSSSASSCSSSSTAATASSARLSRYPMLPPTREHHERDRLVVVMVGLPARCKTFIARKLENYFNFIGQPARVFNVGDRRRDVRLARVPPPTAQPQAKVTRHAPSDLTPSIPDPQVVPDSHHPQFFNPRHRVCVTDSAIKKRQRHREYHRRFRQTNAMSEVATALYDFEGDTVHGELSFTAGTQITITNKNIGDGWWEGECQGSRGLFPESYVEVGAQGAYDSGSDFDDDDDDWDDDMPAPPPDAHDMGGYSAHAPDQGTAGTDHFGRSATLKRSVNRFSTFVKAGAEAFLLGATKDISIDPMLVIHVEEGQDGPRWQLRQQPYGHITIEHCGARSKYKGLKSYEAFLIKGAVPGTEAERRHKHFQWLHDRLVDKYSCLCVPPMPGKEYESKFNENHVKKREERLEAWINRVARHPVLGADVLALKHFLTCSTGDATRWKQGKRDAEKDRFLGAMFFKLISQDVRCPTDSDKRIDQFADFVTEMLKTAKRNIDIAKAHSDRMASSFKREYTKIGSGFELLGQNFGNGGGQTNGDSVRLSQAFIIAADHMNGIGELCAEQPVFDQIPWMEGLKEYMGLLSQFQGCITSSRSAAARVIEVEDREDADSTEKEAVSSRCDIIHTLTLCEMTHFHEQRRKDFRDMMINYLDAQIDFHNKAEAGARDAGADGEDDDDEMHEMEIVNWSGTHRAVTRNFFQPVTVAEVEAIVRRAHETGQRLRVVGSSLSPNGLGLSNDGMLSLANLDEVLEVDAQQRRVRVQAGARVDTVVEALRPHGLTLQNYASIREQQIGGFTQVGAHGTGARLPPVDAQVVALTLVTPNCGTLQLSSDDADPALFLAARLGLGALGVVTDVTLQCVPAHELTQELRVITRAEAVAGHAERLRQWPHVRYMWLPYVDAVVVAAARQTVVGDAVTVSPKQTQHALEPLRQLLRELAPHLDAGSVAQLGFAELRDRILAHAPLDSAHVRRCNHAEAEFWRRSQGVTDIGASDRILGFECGGQQWVNEVCLPAGTLDQPTGHDLAFVERILALIEDHNVAAPCPIEQRWTSASASTLSHAHGDENGPALASWVGIIMYLCREDQRPAITAAFHAYRALVEASLDDEFDAFVHWAKLEIPSEAAALARLRARLRARFDVDAFNRARHKLDPHGVLSNDFIRALFDDE
ncbi:uncharacterized protein MONBRDRAFT_38173 [Monosiga brevicollis MX1]|uniref:Uncharacterized protein n=1 Tax=Monosiga brevicollis TaxID=81824 RepID=A9V636_MONBE|nr:uncharacterized protein MONBRDRAFT_38173 [Monosiga brevicollis MX1]EDQ86918.1 predicted protein [Monosiga brevicollis MX1]|eukprot:XP_001748157.1 hypothetical protein [Monosiga brevicollis MX1]